MNRLRKLFLDITITLPAVSAAYIFCFLVFYFVAFNPSASMPYGFYLRSPVVVSLHEGDLVQVTNPRIGYLGVTTRNLLKRITKITDDGKFVVMGESDNSYDSRYFGAVDRDLITAKVYPLAVSRNKEAFSSIFELANKLENHFIKEI